jgi:hypothetical protein
MNGLTQAAAHMQDVIDPLDEDVPDVDLQLMEEFVQTAAEAAAAAAASAESPSPHQQDLREANHQHPMEDVVDSHVEVEPMVDPVCVAENESPQPQPQAQDLRAANKHLRTHRWVILRASPDLRDVTADWWDRCGVSIASRKGVHWTSLRKRGPTGKKSQQRDANTIPKSKELRAMTETAVRRALASIGVSTDALHCCVIKVLRSPPGAARQKVHIDVPFDATVLDPTTNKKVPKGSRCLSVLLHLNPEPTRGTHVPKSTADVMAALEKKDCRDSNFISHEMFGGDMLVFYDDVPHFGPANESDTEWRWVLFVMFSPEEGPEQDSQQTFFDCGGAH